MRAPYAIARVGERGKTFIEKGEAGAFESSTKTSDNNQNPIWNEKVTVSFDVSNPELHVAIFDFDDVRKHDFLGDAALTLPTGVTASRGTTTVPLKGNKAVVKNGSTVTLQWERLKIQQGHRSRPFANQQGQRLKTRDSALGLSQRDRADKENAEKGENRSPPTSPGEEGGKHLMRFASAAGVMMRDSSSDSSSHSETSTSASHSDSDSDSDSDITVIESSSENTDNGEEEEEEVQKADLKPARRLVQRQSVEQDPRRIRNTFGRTQSTVRLHKRGTMARGGVAGGPIPESKDETGGIADERFEEVPGIPRVKARRHIYSDEKDYLFTYTTSNKTAPNRVKRIRRSQIKPHQMQVRLYRNKTDQSRPGNPLRRDYLPAGMIAAIDPPGVKLDPIEMDELEADAHYKAYRVSDSYNQRSPGVEEEWTMCSVVAIERATGLYEVEVNPFVNLGVVEHIRVVGSEPGRRLGENLEMRQGHMQDSRGGATPVDVGVMHILRQDIRGHSPKHQQIFQRPWGIAVFPKSKNGDCVVVDNQQHCVHVLAGVSALVNSGQATADTPVKTPACYDHTFGSQGRGRGQFMGPRGVAIDSDFRVIVADTQNHRIQGLRFLPGRDRSQKGTVDSWWAPRKQATGEDKHAVLEKDESLLTPKARHRGISLAYASGEGPSSAAGKLAAKGGGRGTHVSRAKAASQSEMDRLGIWDMEEYAALKNQWVVDFIYPDDQEYVDKKAGLKYRTQLANRTKTGKETDKLPKLPKRAEHKVGPKLRAPSDVAVDVYDNYIIADTDNHCIRVFARVEVEPYEYPDR